MSLACASTSLESTVSVTSSTTATPVSVCEPPKAAGVKRRRFSARVPPSKVKKVLQADEEIGRIQAAVPVVLGRAMEHFAEQLLRETAKITHASQIRTVMPAHMKSAIQKNKQFGMLEEVVQSVTHPQTHANHAMHDNQKSPT